jgi:hypothetical protein
MYKAKHAGRGQAAFFETSMTADAKRRFELARELGKRGTRLNLSVVLARERAP